MKVKQIRDLLKAQVLCGEHRLDLEIEKVSAADMMSDVLAFAHEGAVMITGLVNPHVIRTAEMLDLKCIVFVRGKEISEDIINSAREQDMILLNTKLTLYNTCGILYAAGMIGCTR